ncbi:MAG: type II secretion system protein [Phycisphaerae bacterium]|nr:type II secretion system protein [Phycisphaerae bacterium]
MRITRSTSAFSLIELLVVIAIVSLLAGILLPSISAARESGRIAACLSNQRQMALGWAGYGIDHKDRVMPLAYWSAADIGSGPVVYWWGASTSPAVDHDRGFLTPYLDSVHGPRTVYECPSQAWGTYRPQGPAKRPTSTYGYNGYYLSPAKTPGWGERIGFRPWRRHFEIRRPSDLRVFADALLAGSTPSNTALLDPPHLFDGTDWTVNEYPTTAFRHLRPRDGPGLCASARADGGATTDRGLPQWGVSSSTYIASIGIDNDPRYVPDWREWSPRR